MSGTENGRWGEVGYQGVEISGVERDVRVKRRMETWGRGLGEGVANGSW